MDIFPPIVFGLLFALGTSGKSIELDDNELITQFRSINPGTNLISNEIQNQAILPNEKQNYVGKVLPKTTFGNYISLITDALNALTPQGEIVFTNNKRNFKMDVEAMQSLGLTVKPMTELTRDKDFARNKHIHNSWSLIRH